MNVFAWMVGLGASMGLLRVYETVPRWQASRWLNAAITLLLAGLLGARIGYVSLHWPLYWVHPPQILFLWQGGYNWEGALIGSLVALGLLSALWHMSVLRLADGLVPLLAPLTVAIWLGCWLSGVAYGVEVAHGTWWGLPAVDEAGRVGLHFPLQVLAALASLSYLAWLEIRFPPRHKVLGVPSSLAGVGLGLIVLGFSFLRADPSPQFAGLRTDGWAAILLVGVGLLDLIIAGLGLLKVTQRNPQILSQSIQPPVSNPPL